MHAKGAMTTDDLGTVNIDKLEYSQLKHEFECILEIPMEFEMSGMVQIK
jgi:hypothetical protein